MKIQVNQVNGSNATFQIGNKSYSLPIQQHVDGNKGWFVRWTNSGVKPVSAIKSETGYNHSIPLADAIDEAITQKKS